MQLKASIQEEQVGGVVLLHQAQPSGSPASPAQWTSCTQCGCGRGRGCGFDFFSEFDVAMVMVVVLFPHQVAPKWLGPLVLVEYYRHHISTQGNWNG